MCSFGVVWPFANGLALDAMVIALGLEPALQLGDLQVPGLDQQVVVQVQVVAVFVVKGKREETAAEIAKDVGEEMTIGVKENGAVFLFWDRPPAREEGCKEFAPVDKSSDGSGEVPAAHIQHHWLCGASETEPASLCGLG